MSGLGITPGQQNRFSTSASARDTAPTSPPRRSIDISPTRPHRTTTAPIAIAEAVLLPTKNTPVIPLLPTANILIIDKPDKKAPSPTKSPDSNNIPPLLPPLDLSDTSDEDLLFTHSNIYAQRKDNV